MKITFVIQDLFSQGAQYATAMMVRGFIAAGYEVDLILSKVHADLMLSGKTPFEIPHEANVVVLRERKARDNVFELRRYMQETDSFALVSMSPNYTWAMRLASIGLWRRPKLVHVEHGLAGMSYGIEMPTPKPWTVLGARQRFLYRGFDKVLTVSAAGKKDFERYNPFYPSSQVAVVYNPVIDDVFFRKIKEEAVHPWLKEKSCPTFVSAGAYQEYKGHFDLLDAVKMLKGKEKFRIVVFGDGPLRSEYRDYITANGLSDMIDFAGYTNNFPAEAKASDGFVLSSRRESFGIVLVEALACGCPMLSTGAPFGPREILNDGEYGMIVPVRDSQALADGIVQLVHGGIARAPEVSWRRFTLEAAVDRYEKGIGLK